MPLDPKKTVSDAERANLIRHAHGTNAIELQVATKRLENMPVKFPDEAGIQRIWPNKQDRSYRQRPKQPRKWLTKAEAIAKGYSL